LVTVTAARVDTVDGKPGQAVARLEPALAEATSSGLVSLQLEIRLALAEAELASGHVEAGRQRLESLAPEARTRGFRLVASKAAAALARS
jgi:hypothetical protein